MDIFDLRDRLISDYTEFTRSFTRIKAPDIAAQIDAIYASDRYWPEPLLQLSPHFEEGPSIDDLAASGDVHAGTAAVFRLRDDTGRAHLYSAFIRSQGGSHQIAVHGMIVTWSRLSRSLSN